MSKTHSQHDLPPHSSIDIIYKLDVDGHFTYVNSVMLDFLESNEQALIGTQFMQYIRPDKTGEVVLFYLNQVKDKMSSTYLEVPIVNAGGKESWVAQTCNLLYNDEGEIVEILVVARDISERERVKKQARINEEKYQNVIENIKLGLMEVDLDEKIIYVNDSFCDITGYAREELMGRNAKKVFITEEDDETDQKVEEVRHERKQDESSAYELRIKRKNGEYIWVIISGTPVKDNDGRIIGSLGIHHDITSRKEQEIQLEEKNKELKQQQQYLKAVNEFSAALINTDTVREIVEEVTTNIVEKFGFTDCVVYLVNSSRTLLGQVSAYGVKVDNGDLVNPIFIEMGKGVVGFVAESGKAEIVSDTTKDSRYIEDVETGLSELAVPIVSDGEVVGVIDSENPKKNYYTQQHLETLTTISNLAANKIKNAIINEKREMAEFALKENEAKLKAVIDSALDAVITIDEFGVVTEWNTHAEELFGFSKAEAVGTLLSDMIIPEEYREAHENGMRHFLKTGHGPVLNNRIEISGLNKKKEHFPIELSIVPVKNEDQYFFSAFVRDITSRKKLEEDMKLALEKEKEIREMKSKFVSMTSHEFRTPLTTIKSNVELLSFYLDKNGFADNPKIEKNFYRINLEIQRLNVLMNDILMIGRLESGKMPFKPQMVDVKKLCEELVDQKTNDLEIGRTIDIKIIGEAQKVELDTNIYEHVINNLISNALKYSPVDKSPVITLNYLEEHLKISIQDKGIGISEKDQEQLFESFFRADNVGTIQGTGLGLTIVKQFLDMHDGEIKVESEIGKGTIFHIDQPYQLESTKE